MGDARTQTGTRGILVYVCAHYAEESGAICSALRGLPGVYAVRPFADESAMLRRAQVSPPDACVTPAAAVTPSFVAELREKAPECRIIVLGSRSANISDAAGALPSFVAAGPGFTRFIAEAASIFGAVTAAKNTAEAPPPEMPEGDALKILMDRVRHRQETREQAPAPISRAPRDIPEESGNEEALYRSRLNFMLPAHAVAIASSTGGPDALHALFSTLYGTVLTCPVFLTQHMPEHFTGLLAQRLTKASGLICKEGEDGEKPQAGTVYIAPGNYHMRVQRENDMPVIRLDQAPKVNFCRPAADPMMESVAACYGGRTLGIVMTGMGNDGAEGAKLMRAQGGKVVIQNKASCAVWGMPAAVYAAQSYDEILRPEGVASAIAAACCTKLNNPAR